MRPLSLLVATLVCGVIATAGTRAQVQQPRVDHLNLELFEQIPSQYLTAASNLRLLFVNRSVGSNINGGLTCLSQPYATAPNYCKSWQHWAPEFSVPPDPWDRTYPRDRWQYAFWMGSGTPEITCPGADTAYWYGQLKCFIHHIDANPTAYDVVAFQFSYLEVEDSSDITDPETGFFGSNPYPGKHTVADLAALRSRHPNIRFVLMTSSLARSIGTVKARDFNARLRTYAQANGYPLYDFAEFISHSPTTGQPCFDNRDGVPFIVNGEVRENYPNDGLDLPAICAHYTGEVDGGHLGPTVGMIRAAKAWWIMMARLAGWNPGTPGTSAPAAPRNLRIIG